MKIDKTCVVAISGIAFIDNWKYLPATFVQKVKDDTVRFVTHCSPVTEIHNNEEVSNFDLWLDGRVAPGRELSLREPDHSFMRYSKITQGLMLRKATTRAGAKHYIPNEILNKHLEGIPDNQHKVSNLPRKVLIKTVNGARGLGHILFDTHRGDVFGFISALSGSSNNDQVKETLSAYSDALEFHKGEIRYEEEALATLRSQQLLLTSLVPNIKKEMRVILDRRSRPSLVKVRKRRSTRDETVSKLDSKDSTYLQATGAVKESRVDKFTDVVPDMYQSEIRAVLKELPPLNSVDLFFTDKGWGIFEFCCQFGTYAFEVEDVVKLHKDFLVHLYASKIST